MENNTLLGEGFDTSNQEVSQMDEINPIGFPGRISLVVGCYLALVIIFGAVGNLLVILVFYKTPKLRTPTYVLIVNLSVSDFIVSCFGTPLSCSSTFVGHWLYGIVGCNYYGFVNYYCGCISLNSYATIAIIRYFKVVKREVGAGILKAHIVRVLYIVHGYTFVFTIPPLFGWNAFVLEGYRTQCDIAYKIKTPLYISYMFVMFIALFFIPLFIITFCYLGIIRHVTYHKARLKRSLQRSGSTRTFRGSSHYRTTFIVLICFAVFLIAWLPYCIVALWALLGDPDKISQAVSAAPALLAKSSSVFNPWIFAGLNRQFRRKLKVRLMNY